MDEETQIIEDFDHLLDILEDLSEKETLDEETEEE